MASPKMKASVPDRTQHFVIVEVDGAVDEIMAASAEDADAVAGVVIDAAVALSTVRVAVGGFSSGGYVVVGHIVFDLGKARRTAVRVESRSLQFASMGIKK